MSHREGGAAVVERRLVYISGGFANQVPCQGAAAGVSRQARVSTCTGGAMTAGNCSVLSRISAK